MTLEKRPIIPMLLIVWILSFLSISCDLVGNGDDSSATTQHAVSYPTQTVDTAYNSTTVVTFTDLTTFANYAAERFGAPGENLANWPEAVGFSVTYLMMGHPVTVTAHTYQLVNNVVFFEYCNWYEPNNTLGITLSNINETSVSNSISTSVGISIGYANSAISASISQETTKTVTTAKGIEVSTSYDLTQYDQSKLYKVVLTGSYSCVAYTFATARYSGNTDGISVDQGSLTVKLVYKP
ncbi:hypothetical protein [Sediminispirochaeta smaragdinae]|uniref:Lipoprotein n=1 Tax=Sediminispirochaeta smaragdinae (strain DSM 11293 / JCM 15392 / SEBR 4228) TaxID=573413 RepID=E1RCC5_SEDSS|nr:hypothetical protein [Sediminispirochaeta smaragdinae]ADK80005.1 hypothetical protein Spirs_0871 [Sediminispirochaeta smaragdinae DSM 11293]